MLKQKSWSVTAVAIAFGLLYAYDLFEAISNLIEVPVQLAAYNKFLIENDITPEPVPWVVLIGNLLTPVAAFVIAYWLGRKRSLLLRVLAYAAGLAVVAALTLTFTAMV
ncbi:MAG: hypothetical protein JWP30_2003 [Homoserinimonas sp.]|jgi:hypothetical protein|nr:hypothetical protein [Homoserinimonas sp.]